MDVTQSSKKSKKKEHTSIWRKGDSSSKSREQVKISRSDPNGATRKTRSEPSSEKLPRKSSGRSFGQVIAPLTRRTAGFTRAASFSLKKKRPDPPPTTVQYDQRAAVHPVCREPPQQYVSRTYKTPGRHNQWMDNTSGHCSRTYTDFDQWEVDIPEIAIQDYSTFYSDDVEDQTDYFRQAEWAIQLLEEHLDHDLHVSVAIRPINTPEDDEDENNKIETCTGSNENEESDFKRGLSSLIYPLSTGAATIVQKSSRVADLTNRLFRSMHIDIIRKRRALTPKQENSEANASVDSSGFPWNKMGGFSKNEKDHKSMPLQD